MIAVCQGRKGNYNLRVLDLSGFAGLTDKGIAFAAQSCPGLERVHLNHCIGITDVSLSFLGAR